MGRDPIHGGEPAHQVAACAQAGQVLEREMRPAVRDRRAVGVQVHLVPDLGRGGIGEVHQRDAPTGHLPIDRDQLRHPAPLADEQVLGLEVPVHQRGRDPDRRPLDPIPHRLHVLQLLEDGVEHRDVLAGEPGIRMIRADALVRRAQVREIARGAPIGKSRPQALERGLDVHRAQPAPCEPRLGALAGTESSPIHVLDEHPVERAALVEPEPAGTWNGKPGEDPLVDLALHGQRARRRALREHGREAGIVEREPEDGGLPLAALDPGLEATRRRSGAEREPGPHGGMLGELRLREVGGHGGEQCYMVRLRSASTNFIFGFISGIPVRRARRIAGRARRRGRAPMGHVLERPNRAGSPRRGRWNHVRRDPRLRGLDGGLAII